MPVPGVQIAVRERKILRAEKKREETETVNNSLLLTAVDKSSAKGRTIIFLERGEEKCNLVPRSRGWAKPKARSGQVRKFDFF